MRGIDMSNNIDEKELNNKKYSDVYSDSSFWDKLKKFATKVGVKGVYYAVTLYLVLQKDDVPMKAKGIIIGALGYFIFPIDLIPDLIPVAGYSDDIAGLLLALGQVSMYVDESVKREARSKIKAWFDISDDELEAF